MKTGLILIFIFANMVSIAQVEISGTAKNFRDSIFYLHETGGFNNITRVWRDNRIQILIDNQGNFTATVPEYDIGEWYVKNARGEYQVFHLMNGTKVKLVADFLQQDPILAVGKGAADFNFGSYANMRIRNYRKEKNFLQRTQNQNIDSVLAAWREFSVFKQELAADYDRKYDLSTDYFDWLSSEYKYEPYPEILRENVNRDSINESVVSKIMTNGIDDEYAAMHTPAYNDLVDFYTSYRMSGTNASGLTAGEKFTYVADGDLLKGTTRDVYLSRQLAMLRMAPDSIYDPMFSQYDQLVSNKKIKQLVLTLRNDYKKPVVSSASADKILVNSLPDIFSKYKGKIIYVDFWASWCVPCRAEMPNAALLKNKLKDKGIVFLYLAYRDREQAWSKARAQLSIEGEHYLLNDTLNDEVRDMFGINGIPHYAIIDKYGNVIRKKAMPPGKIYNELLALSQQ